MPHKPNHKSVRKQRVQKASTVLLSREGSGCMIFLEDRPQKAVPLGLNLLKHQQEEMNHWGIKRKKKRRKKKNPRHVTCSWADEHGSSNAGDESSATCAFSAALYGKQLVPKAVLPGPCTRIPETIIIPPGRVERARKSRICVLLHLCVPQSDAGH